MTRKVRFHVAALLVAAACLYVVVRIVWPEARHTAVVDPPVAGEQREDELAPVLPVTEAGVERMVVESSPGDAAAVVTEHVLRVILEGLSDADAPAATVTLTGADPHEHEHGLGPGRLEIRDSWSAQGLTSEFDLGPFLERVERAGELRPEVLEVEVEHPGFLVATTRVVLSHGVERDGRIVHEARLALVPPEFWPEFHLSVRDAHTRAHLDGVELSTVTPAMMGTPRMPGTAEFFTSLGAGLRSPIRMRGGRQAEDPERHVAGVELQSSGSEVPRLVELSRIARVGAARGLIVYARAPGYAWNSIVIDVSKGDRELLLVPSGTLHVRLSNVQLELYEALETVANLCVYWIREDGGVSYVRFQDVDEAIATDGLRLEGLEPGRYAVTVELGAGMPFHERPVLAREEVSLVAGGTREVLLALGEPPPPVERASLGGVVSFPTFGGEDDVRLQLYHQPTQTYRHPEVEFSLAELQPVGGALPSWSFRADDLPVGLYRVQLLPFVEVRMVELPVDGRDDVEIVLPELAEVLVETVDGRTGERVPLDEFYYRRQESHPRQEMNDWVRTDTEAPGRFRFWTAPGPVTIWPRSQDELGYGDSWEDRDLVAGFQSLRFELPPIYGMHFEFREDGTAMPVGDPGMFVMQNIRAVGHEGRVTSDGLQTDMHVDVSAPGLYEIHFDGIDSDRYHPLPPRRVEVRAGEPTPVIVELQRK